MVDNLESRLSHHHELVLCLEGVSPEIKARIIQLAYGLAMEDPLTGLSNKAALDRKIEDEIARTKRHGHELAVVMLDIDYFKLYNDTYGHEQGNIALKHLATVLSLNRRPEDMVARYGGEEFAIILPETGKDGAFKIARDIKNRLNRKKVVVFVGDETTRDKRYYRKKGYQNLTVSTGISVFPSITQQPTLLIADADRALYQAKKTGRNRIEVYKPNFTLPNPSN